MFDLIFEESGPLGLEPDIFQGLVTELAGFVITALILGGIASLTYRWYSDWRLKPVRKRAAQLLWSSAANAVYASKSVQDAKQTETLGELDIHSIFLLFEWAIENVKNFTQDHVSILPPAAFNHSSELRMNAEFAQRVISAADQQDTVENACKLQIRFFAANLNNTNEITQMVGLSEIGVFFLYTVLPMCKTLGLPEMPPEVSERLSKFYGAEDATQPKFSTKNENQEVEQEGSGGNG